MKQNHQRFAVIYAAAALLIVILSGCRGSVSASVSEASSMVSEASGQLSDSSENNVQLPEMKESQQAADELMRQYVEALRMADYPRMVELQAARRPVTGGETWEGVTLGEIQVTRMIYGLNRVRYELLVPVEEVPERSLLLVGPRKMCLELIQVQDKWYVESFTGGELDNQPPFEDSNHYAPAYGIAFDLSDLDQAVSHAVITHFRDRELQGECVSEGHIVLLEEGQWDETVTVSIEEMYGEFGFENGIFTMISGHRVPAKLVFDYQDGAYRLKEYTIPQSGSGYADSIKEILPPAAQERLKEADQWRDSLYGQMEAYAQGYLYSIGRDAMVQAGYVEKELADINAEASNILLNIYPEYPYWVGTLERLEENVRYVYETAWEAGESGDGVITYTKSIYKDKIVEKTVIRIQNGSIIYLEGEAREDLYSQKMQGTLK